MRRVHSLRPAARALLPLAVLLAALLVPASAAADAPEPPAAWAAPIQHLRTGRRIETPGVTLLALTLPRAHQVEIDATVGLVGAQAEVMALPGPAGVWHVRVANREARPLLLPAGETLLTPAGPSRSTDRPIWIAPHAATFVPVIQATSHAPQGPYLSRGRGLTPLEQGLGDLDRLARRVRTRNARMGVPLHRQDDAAAAYATPRFQELAGTYRNLLGPLADGERVVGVIVADDRGSYAAHIQFDARRFLALWPALLDSIALDAAIVEGAGLKPAGADLQALQAEARRLLQALERTPSLRPNLGVGWEVHWPVPGEEAAWTGLVVGEGLVSLDLHRNPPRPKAAPKPAGGGAAPGGPSRTEPTPTPGLVELVRRGPRNAYEQRLLERRAGVVPRVPTVPTARPPVRPTPTPVRTPTRGGGGASSGGIGSSLR